MPLEDVGGIVALAHDLNVFRGDGELHLRADRTGVGGMHQQHDLKNTGKTPATVLWVCTPPNF